MADGRLAVDAPAGIRGVAGALVAFLMLLVPAAAQTPPDASQAGARVFCEQSVEVEVADRTLVPRRFRRFLGVWSDAAWDARTCAALIVEDVKPDGTAAVVYVYGPLDDTSSVRGGILHGTGIIRDGELLFQNSDGTQFAFRPDIVDLDGQLTTPRGATFTARFKKTP